MTHSIRFGLAATTLAIGLATVPAAPAALVQPLPTPGTLFVEDDTGVYDMWIMAKWCKLYAIAPSELKIAV